MSHVALMEYERALASRFRYPEDVVVEALRRLLQVLNVIVDRPDVFKAAIDDFASGGAEFTGS